MKAAFCILAMALVASSAVADLSDYDLEDGVLVLHDGDFDNAIAEFDPLLVEFYAPWCGHCKKLAPEYAKAASALAEEDPPLYIAKVDATAEKKVADQFEIQGFPTLKFFRGGKPTEYGGGRTEKDIISWVKKKSGPVTVALADADAAKRFTDSEDVVVIGFFADDAEAKTFATVAAQQDSIPFGIVSDAAVAEELEAKMGDIVLFKDFDEGRNNYDGDASDEEALNSFVGANSLPLVIDFSQEMAPKIFGGPIKVHYLLFADADADYYDELKAQYAETAKALKGRALAIVVGLDNERVMSYFGVGEDDLPTAVLVNMPEGAAMKKYMFEEEDLNAETMTTFGNKYFDGELKPFLKSDPIPEDNSDPVKVVVGKNFEDLVLDDSKDVLLEFYAPWCGHCKALAPKYDELAEKLADVDHIVVAKMDATANEVDHPGVDVRGFPTIKFFKAGDKENVMDYDGEREVDGFIKFLQQHSSQDFSLDGDDGGEL